MDSMFDVGDVVGQTKERQLLERQRGVGGRAVSLAPPPTGDIDPGGFEVLDEAGDGLFPFVL